MREKQNNNDYILTSYFIMGDVQIHVHFRYILLVLQIVWSFFLYKWKPLPNQNRHLAKPNTVMNAGSLYVNKIVDIRIIFIL